MCAGRATSRQNRKAPGGSSGPKTSPHRAMSGRARPMASSPRTGTKVKALPADQFSAAKLSKPRSDGASPSARREPRRVADGAEPLRHDAECRSRRGRRRCRAAPRRRTGPTSSASTTSRDCAAAIEMREQHRGPDRRMAGERQFARRREDAQPRPLLGIVRGQHEHGLRQVEFARDRLHGGGVEAVGVEHDGQRIAGEWLGGEDIEGEEAAAHDALTRVRVGRRVLGLTNSSWASTSSSSLAPASAVRLRTPKIAEAARDNASAAEPVAR